MKLVRVGEMGAERPGVMVDGDLVVDVSDVVRDFDSSFFRDGGAALLEPLLASRVANGMATPLAGRRLGPPVARPHQILCVGLNYSDHAIETGQAIPTEPILFNKAPNTLIGPDDDVIVPPTSVKTDWEVELGIVIGRGIYRARDADEARDAIAGYVLVNDVSEREWQMERGGQWVKGKSAPTFNPAGPYLVTPDEVGDVGNLDMELSIDGVIQQNGSTSTMLFDPVEIVRYASQFIRLEPGDLMNTGTPPGVGMSQSPPRFLHGGETMSLSISGLGRQTQRVRATDPA